MIIQKITGIILHIRPHGEFDKIFTIFSQEAGLLRVIAKGVRKIKSRRGCHMDLFNEVCIETEKSGKSSAGAVYLREISVINHFLKLKTNPAAFSAACVISSFLTRSLPEGSAQKEIFKNTEKALLALSAGEDFQKTLRRYFLEIMHLLGVSPKEPESLQKIMSEFDPQFILNARRTLGTFSKLESSASS